MKSFPPNWWSKQWTPEVAQADPDAAIAWVDAEGVRIKGLAVGAGSDPESARKDWLAAVLWYESVEETTATGQRSARLQSSHPKA